MIFRSFELTVTFADGAIAEQLQCVLPGDCQDPVFFSPKPWIPLSFDW